MSGKTETAQPTGVKAVINRTRKSFSKATDAMMTKVADLKDTKKHTITFSADPAATVAVAGTFNNWEPTPMKFNEKKGGVFTCKVPVKAGSSIEYKFVVNGNWVCDESAPTTNNNGNINNVFTL